MRVVSVSQYPGQDKKDLRQQCKVSDFLQQTDERCGSETRETSFFFIKALTKETSSIPLKDWRIIGVRKLLDTTGRNSIKIKGGCARWVFSSVYQLKQFIIQFEFFSDFLQFSSGSSKVKNSKSKKLFVLEIQI